MTNTPAICRTCRWWAIYAEPFGECRRFPPGAGIGKESVPCTPANFWCGEHEAKETEDE